MRIFEKDSILYAETEPQEDPTAKALQMSWNEDAGLWQLPLQKLPQIPLSKLERMLTHAEASARDVIEPFFEREKNQVALSEASDLEIALRAPPKLDYMAFQKAGIAYALSRNEALIADEMGLGKTVQAIGVVNNDPRLKNIVIVCPASLKLNWAKELGKWCSRPAFVRVLAPKGDQKTVGDPFEAEISVMVVNYDIIDKVLKVLPKRVDLLVADEAHYVKNQNTKRSDALREIAKNSRKKLFLTGTPILNRPIELWNILDTLQPGAWGSMQDFGIRYANGHKRFVGNGRVIWNFKGSSNLDELHEKLRRNIMVRRLKKDVLTDLPDKIRQIVPLDVTYKEKSTTAQQSAKIKKLWEKAQKANSDEAYHAAIQDLDKEVQINFEDLARVRHEIAQQKAPHVAQFVKDMLENVDKVVVFAHHKDVVKHLAKALEPFGVVTLTGETAATKKQEAVERFQKDEKTRVFVGNILAAGAGHTLTRAQHVVFAELDWVPGNVKQAEDRCHRIGQTDTVFVYHLVVDNSIDVILANTIVGKLEVEAAALGKGNGGQRKSITRQSLHSESYPFFTDVEKEAMRYALCYLAKADRGYIEEDRAIGLKLAAHILRGKKLTDKHYAYSYNFLEKYAKTRLEKKVVHYLYPEIARWRKMRQKQKRAMRYDSALPTSTQQIIEHDPTWGEAEWYS